MTISFMGWFFPAVLPKFHARSDGALNPFSPSARPVRSGFNVKSIHPGGAKLKWQQSDEVFMVLSRIGVTMAPGTIKVFLSRVRFFFN